MCRSIVNIQSPTTEIRRGKKEKEERKKERRKKLQGKNIMAPYYIGRHKEEEDRNYRMKI